MSAMDVGERLVALCREGKNFEAIDELYANDIVSLEASDGPDGVSRTSEGIDAVRGKGQWWYDNHEIHGASVEGPWPNGDDRFAAIFEYDVTFKPANQRFTMREVAVYTVQDGKVTREEFFYSMG